MFFFSFMAGRFVALFWMRIVKVGKKKKIPLHVHDPFKFIQQVMPTFEMLVKNISCIPSNIYRHGCALFRLIEKNEGNVAIKIYSQHFFLFIRVLSNWHPLKVFGMEINKTPGHIYRRTVSQLRHALINKYLKAGRRDIFIIADKYKVFGVAHVTHSNMMIYAWHSEMPLNVVIYVYIVLYKQICEGMEEEGMGIECKQFRWILERKIAKKKEKFGGGIGMWLFKLERFSVNL